jgi:mRNA interferase YafQ
MLKIRYHHTFKKDYKLMKKRGKDLAKLKYVVNELANQRPLDEKYRDHELTGNYRNFRECHIEPDWLLIYRIEKGELTLALVRTGTHSDLF